MLTPKQSRFVEEYLVDLNGKQAAIRAGYSANTAEVQASRLLRIVKIQVALSAAMRARSRNTEVTPDRVLAELAKIGFANMRDYWPKEGETVDLHRLDQELTAALQEITIDETIDPSGVVHRHTRLSPVSGDVRTISAAPIAEGPRGAARACGAPTAAVKCRQGLSGRDEPAPWWPLYCRKSSMNAFAAPTLSRGQ
jgi:phage terminase small subunit